MEKNRAIAKVFEESIALKTRIVSDHIETLVKIADGIYDSLSSGGKLLLCGNGGSAADAQHLAAEYLIRLRSNVDRMPIPALSLATDMSSVTACSNDYSFDHIFIRPLMALGKKGDVLIGLTTSGNSKNVLEALKKAHEMGITTIGFLGGTGGAAKDICDLAFIVPSDNTARIQEAHITAGHAILELVEDRLIGKN